MRRQSLTPYFFILPFIVWFVIFVIWPVSFSFYVSLNEWNGLTPMEYVGLENYLDVFDDRVFWIGLRNSFFYCLLVPAYLLGGLGLALLLSTKVKGQKFFRTVYFLPVITSVVAMSMIWTYFYHPVVGAFNDILRRLDLPSQPWLSSTTQSLPSVMTMAVYMSVGYGMLIFLAGIEEIPEALYDAAKIDGAGAWSRFRNVTLPMLKPTILFLSVTSIIWNLQVFTEIYMMTMGGPAESSYVLMLYVYEQAWRFLRFGRACALTFIFFGIVMAVTAIQLLIMRKGGVLYYWR